MRTSAQLLLGVTGGIALALAWGYWYSLNHASLQLRVEDYSLKSRSETSEAYGVPHGVSLTFRDRTNAQLAVARSVEPLGYILVIHPNPHIGNCEHRGMQAFEACYEQYSAWAATWAPHVHSADVTVDSCDVRGAPVTSRMSNEEWLLWWVPLPHVGGLPRRRFELAVAIDSRACVAVTRERPA